jgi:RNA polymerase sigma-70 factor (ECF subfamily)
MVTASVQAPVPVSFAQELQAAQPALMALALKFTRNRSRAQDLLHDTLERALRYQESYRPGSRFRSWASTIMAHTFISQYRRQKREHAWLITATAHEVSDRTGGDASVVAARGALHALCESSLSDATVHALNQLSPSYRAVVVMCDIRGLSYKAVAKALGCPIGTVMSRLHRARRQLQGALSGKTANTGPSRAALGARAA